MHDLKNTDDKALVAKLMTLACAERVSQVEILKYLSEVDERRLVLELGYSGMWDFCRRALKFSESTSTRRINVARAAREYPVLLTMLEKGQLTLCTAADLVPLLTAGNAAILLGAASGKSRWEVQNLGVAPNAKPVERDVIRRIPAKVLGPLAPAGLGFAEPTGEPRPVDVVEAAPAPRPVLLRVAFNADEEVVRKLERLQEILGGATLAEVCDRAAEVLLDKVDPVRRAKRREAKGDRVAMQHAAKRDELANGRAARTDRSAPRRGAKAAGAARQVSRVAVKTEPRRPSKAVADQVIAESGARCSYLSSDGVRCAETRFLSIDHIQPYALGGSSTKTNSRCYCMAHNRHAGRQTFGNVHRER